MPCGASPSLPGLGTKSQLALLPRRGSHAQWPAVATRLRFLAATALAEHQYSLPPSWKKTLPMVLAAPPLAGVVGWMSRAAARLDTPLVSTEPAEEEGEEEGA